MSKITIKSIQHLEKVSQGGKQYTSCRIIVVGKDENDVNLSGFGSPITRSWNSGDIVDVDVSQTEQGYWNFKENKDSRPSKTAIDYLKELNFKIDTLLARGVDKAPEEIKTCDELLKEKEGDIKVEDIPF